MSGRYEQETKYGKMIETKLKTVPPIITEYYYSLIGSGKSYATAYNYINYVLSFIDYTFGDRCSDDFYKRVTSTEINKYIVSLRTKSTSSGPKRTSDSFRALSWSALNSFFRFLVPEHLNVNPVASTEKPKNKDNPTIEYLTAKEISKILKNVENIAKDKYKHRDLCVLKLGFSTGLRVSAITQIDVDDIDFVNNKIKVTEKGDYDNYVMFGDNLKEQLLLWLSDREKYFDTTQTKALFISSKSGRLSHDGVDEMFKKYAKGVTDKKVHPHVMRHSCATNLYEKTGDIYLCAKQLHHKNVTTTQRYAELSNEKQKAATNILDQLI